MNLKMRKRALDMAAHLVANYADVFKSHPDRSRAPSTAPFSAYAHREQEIATRAAAEAIETYLDNCPIEELLLVAARRLETRLTEAEAMERNRLQEASVAEQQRGAA